MYVASKSKRGLVVIHLITAENRSAYRRELVNYHLVRKSVFVDELGWDLTLHDGLEIDEYDDHRAIYAIGFDIDGNVAVSGRFRPTDDRSMLTDHFAHVLPADVRPINDGRTWEVSRAFSVEYGDRRHSFQRKAACILTTFEVAMAHGADRCVGFSDLRVLPFFDSMSMGMRLLGEPTPYGEGDGVAYEIDLCEERLSRIRRVWNLPKPAHIYLRPEDLGDLTPIERAEQIALTDPLQAQLLPRKPTGVARKRLKAQHHYDRYATARRLKAIAKLNQSRPDVNHSEGFSV